MYNKASARGPCCLFRLRLLLQLLLLLLLLLLPTRGLASWISFVHSSCFFSEDLVILFILNFGFGGVPLGGCCRCLNAGRPSLRRDPQSLAIVLKH